MFWTKASVREGLYTTFGVWRSFKVEEHRVDLNRWQGTPSGRDPVWP